LKSVDQNAFRPLWNEWADGKKGVGVNDKNSKMRAGDLVIAVLFLLLGCYILIGAFRMPLKDSYGGVESTWYVSPALFPIIIAIVMILLSVSVFRYAWKRNGWVMIKDAVARRRKEPVFNENTIRFLSVIIPMVSIVYVNLERMDFFFAVLLYLSFTIGVFFMDEGQLRRHILTEYSAMMLLNVILAICGFKNVFLYSFDVVALIEMILLYVFYRKEILKCDVREQRNLYKKLKTTMLISIIVPLSLEIVFRFGLRVPMPFEGSVMNLMYLVYYAVR